MRKYLQKQEETKSIVTKTTNDAQKDNTLQNEM